MVDCGEHNDNETACLVEFYIVQSNSDDGSQTADYQILIDSEVLCDDKVTIYDYDLQFASFLYKKDNSQLSLLILSSETKDYQMPHLLFVVFKFKAKA